MQRIKRYSMSGKAGKWCRDADVKRLEQAYKKLIEIVAQAVSGSKQPPEPKK